MAQWSVAIRKPSDLGYDDGDFILPALRVHSFTVPGATPPGYLLPIVAQTLQERRDARRASLKERVAACAELVNASNEQWVVWCDLNAESEALARAIPDAVEVTGSDTNEHKTAAMLGFSAGRHRVIVSKPSICGFGMNWQHCCNMAFVGLSDSYEQQYQAIRRCWRFGQTRPVDVHVITATTEGAVVDNIKRKERQAAAMFDNIVKHMAVNSKLNKQTRRMEMTYETDVAAGRNWTLYLGDSIETIDSVSDESVGFCLFSPPFPGMYAYTNSVHDIGNCDHIDQMIDHFRYLVGESKLMRVMLPGRLVAVHLMQLTAMKNRDGYIGVKDYRGRVIAMMQEEGWIYHGEVTIDKNPQIQATRNKERALLFKSLATDSSVMRMALADYLLLFRKPGENPAPIKAGMSAKYNPGGGWISEAEWIRWAHPVWPAPQVVRELDGSEYDIADLVPPVWYRQVADPAKGSIEIANPYGIRETDVLNVRQARETDDERHLCPLQLGVIHRAIKLWSAPGEIVYSPFAGVGSEGYEAVKLGREFIGGELKRSYWESAIDNLKQAERERTMPTLFDMSAIPVASANGNNH
jgi:DNA modification methylase